MLTATDEELKCFDELRELPADKLDYQQLGAQLYEYHRVQEISNEAKQRELKFMLTWLSIILINAS